MGAGWPRYGRLGETSMGRRGYGLIVAMSLGVGASLVGGSAILALSGLRGGMLGTLVVGFVLAASVILAQRLGWPGASGARECRARLRLVELGRPSLGGDGTASARLGTGDGRRGRPVSTRALVRMATTRIYLRRGMPIELQRAARGRAVSEGTTLRQVLLKGLGEYAAGTWTPRPDDTPPVALDPGLHATGR